VTGRAVGEEDYSHGNNTTSYLTKEKNTPAERDGLLRKYFQESARDEAWREGR